MTHFGTQKSLEPLYTCHLCCVISGVTVHVKMWRAAGVSVHTNKVDTMASASKFLGVTRINVCYQDTSGPLHFVSKLPQDKMHFGVTLRSQQILTCGRLPQEGRTRLHQI